MLTWPDVFFTNEEIMPIVVDFPAPLGPKRAKKSPDCPFSIVMPIDGKTEFAAMLVPDCPVKKLCVKVNHPILHRGVDFHFV